MQSVPLLQTSVTTTRPFCFNSEVAKLYEAIAYRVRLTGAGFKGACVALIAASKAKAIAKDAIERYKRSRYAGRILVPEVS